MQEGEDDSVERVFDERTYLQEKWRYWNERICGFGKLVERTNAMKTKWVIS